MVCARDSARGALCRVDASGVKVGFVVAEEGFHDEEGSGRDDLCSRLVKIGMAATGMSEEDLRSIVGDNETELKISVMADARPERPPAMPARTMVQV